MNSDDLPESPADAEPAPQPVEQPADAPLVIAEKRRPRWRKWLFYALATLGALAVLLIVLVLALVHHDHTTAPAIDRDAQVDGVMTAAYGRYSETDKGWLYVEPGNKTTYLMQVVQRAKVELPDTGVKGNTALYFVASGRPVVPNGNDSDHVLGLFVVQPDASRPDNALVQISDPTSRLDGYKAVAAEDIRFEVLSKDTWGWVFKATRNRDMRDGAVQVDDLLYAPHDGRIELLAKFPASGLYNEKSGCTTPEAARIADAKLDAQAEADAASAAAAAASAASAAASDNEESNEGEGEGEGEERPVANCLDYAWTYRTSALPADGFVDFVVTGGGLVNGEQRPIKGTKLVFDPKSFTYLVPETLQGF